MNTNKKITFLMKLKYLFFKPKKKIYNQFFWKVFPSIRLEDIVTLTKSHINGTYDTEKIITNIATLEKATESDISFYTNTKYIDDLKNTKAGAVFVKDSDVNKLPNGTIAIINKNPHIAYTKCLMMLYRIPIFWKNYGISRKANIAWSAKIGKKVEIQSGAFIGKNVIIGNNCKICANAIINDNCKIGDGTYIGSNSVIMCANIGKECVIHNGAMIGQCGFGFSYDLDEKIVLKVPQIGKVVINDYVEIGANSCVDRGAFEDTVIGMGTKIDNLVQVAHGVKIGMGCFLAAQVGIAGSTEIGNFVQIGGSTAVTGHIKISDGVEIAGHSGVAKSIKEQFTKWGGYPAVPQIAWHKSTIALQNMIKSKKNKE